MSKPVYAIWMAALLAGCASPIVYEDRNSITIEHDKGDFREAMGKAVKHCAGQGKAVKHDATDCPAKCISTFSCTAK